MLRVMTVVALMITMLCVQAREFQVDRQKFAGPTVIDLPTLAITRAESFDQILHDIEALDSDPQAIAHCQQSFEHSRSPNVIVGSRFHVKYGYKFAGEIPKCKDRSCRRRNVMKRRYQCEITVISNSGSYVQVEKKEGSKKYYEGFLDGGECFAEMLYFPEYYQQGATVAYQVKTSEAQRIYFDGSPYYFYRGEVGYGTPTYLSGWSYSYCEFTIVK